MKDMDTTGFQMDNSGDLSARCVFAFRNTHAENDFEPHPHCHPCTEIVFFTKVCGWLHEDGRKWRYGPNQVGVYQPGTRHWPINDRDSFGSHTCIGTVGKASSAIPACVYEANQDLILLFKLIENALAAPKEQPLQQAHLDLLVNLVCLALSDMSRTASKPKGHAQIAKQVLDTQFMEPLTMDELASRIFISGDHLRQLFRKEFGIGPIHYLLRKRIEHAQGLLQSSDRKIYEIAHECGFDDPYYFSRIFKKISGRSPEAFRKNGKGS